VPASVTPCGWQRPASIGSAGDRDIAGDTGSRATRHRREDRGLSGSRPGPGWLAQLGGDIELYRFASNLEAQERLASAAMPVDAIIVTPHQDTLFNLSAPQLVRPLLGATA